MDDSSGSDELEEGNIFQKARVSQSRKRSFTGSRSVSPIKSSRRRIEEPTPTDTVNNENTSFASHPLHPVSLSSSPDHDRFQEIQPPPGWSRPSLTPLAENVIDNHEESIINEHRESLSIPEPDAKLIEETENMEIVKGSNHSGSQTPEEVRDYDDITSDITSEFESDGLTDQMERAVSQLESVNSAGEPMSSQPKFPDDTQTIGELLAKLPFIEVPLLESMPVPINIRDALSRSDSIKLEIVTASLTRLHERAQKVSQSSKNQESVNIASSPNEDVANNEVIQQIWTSSKTLAQVAALKIQVRQLQAFRLRLMQEITDLKYTSGINSASERAYEQSKQQIDEAKIALQQSQRDDALAKQLVLDVETIQENVHSLQSDVSSKEEELRSMTINEITKIKTLLTGAGKISTSSEDDIIFQKEKSIERDIRDISSQFGAEVRFEQDSVVISQLYMNLDVNSKQHNQIHSDFDTPPVVPQFFRYFKTLSQRDTETRSITDTLRLWNTCSGMRTHSISISPYGPYKFENDTDGSLIFRQRHVKRDQNIFIRFNGVRVTIGEDPSDIRDLPPLLALSKYASAQS